MLNMEKIMLCKEKGLCREKVALMIKLERLKADAAATEEELLAVSKRLATAMKKESTRDITAELIELKDNIDEKLDALISLKEFAMCHEYHDRLQSIINTIQHKLK